jgi:hypothetical protein
MARRRVGAAGARTLAAAPLPEAVESLAHTPYGRWVHPGDALSVATRGLATTMLWNLRVLAGWLPAKGAETLRVLAGWFEIANTEEHLRALGGEPAEPPFALGTLATAWPQLAAATTRAEVRTVLAASPWGDPGGDSDREIQLSMRLAWAYRVATRDETAATWAMGGAALLVARELLVRRQPLPGAAGAPGSVTMASRLLGSGWSAAVSLDGLRAALPAAARWALAGVAEPAELWRAEAGWWRRLRRDATGRLARSGFGPERIIGVAALLAADAWLVRAALEAAARGADGLEVFDAVA